MIKVLSIFFLLFLVFGCGDTKDKPVEEKTIEKLEEALKKTTEWQEYDKAFQAVEKAKLALEETEEWKEYLKAWQEFYDNSIEYQTYQKAYMNTPEYQALEKARQAWLKARQVLEETEEWQAFDKAKE